MESTSEGRKCHLCKSGDIETDYSKGESFCVTCGAVQEDEIIRNTVQFDSGNTGHNSLCGRNVGLEVEGYLGQTGDPRKGGIARSSREATLSKNEDRLKHLATQSKCTADIQTGAFRVYKLAYDSGVTRKRHLDTLLCACLYISARRLKTGHMLSDFAHLLEGDIFDLSKTVRTLTVRLCIDVPLLDPMMQVERFCNELVPDRSLVPRLVQLGYRLVERMKKDWIDAGRKPAAVAAAAVIIACRVHSIELDLDDVAAIAQVSGATIKRRMTEFARTESAKLLPSEFETEDLPREKYHPANFNTRRGKCEGPADQKDMDNKTHARCMDTLTSVVLALSKKEFIVEEDMEDVKHSLVALNTTVEMLETRWKFTVEKSVFMATDLHYAIGDEEFVNGTNIVCKDLLQSLMTNEAEQQVRGLNLKRKFGVLLRKRADKKAELQDEDTQRVKQVRAKRRQTKQTGTRERNVAASKAPELMVSNRVDYDRFNSWMKDLENSDQE